MPRKTKAARAAETAATPQIPAELLEQHIPGPVTPAQFEDIFQRFKKAFIERALGAEMSQHLGYAPGQTLGGTILLEALPLLSARRLRLRIQIGSETHEVDFAVQR